MHFFTANDHAQPLESGKIMLKKKVTAILVAGLAAAGAIGLANTNGFVSAPQTVQAASDTVTGTCNFNVYIDGYGKKYSDVVTLKNITASKTEVVNVTAPELSGYHNVYLTDAEIGVDNNKVVPLYEGRLVLFKNGDKMPASMGPAVSYNKYVKIQYTWHSVFTNQKQVDDTTNLVGNTYLAKVIYREKDAPSFAFVSLYDGNGKWVGYVSEDAVTASKAPAYKPAAIKPAAKPQGNAIKYNKYVTVTKKGNAVWSGFDFKTKKTTTDKLYQKTLLAKVKYNHSNGSTYLSLYDNKGKWLGYVNAKAVKVGSGQQGGAISAHRYVTLTSKSYKIWSDFGFKTVKHYSKNYYQKTYQVKTVYNHFSGSTYLSLYDSKGKWFGYINQSGTKTAAGQQGIAITYKHTVTIKKTGYTIWGSFFGKKRGTSTKYKNKKLTAKVKYNCANGSTYLSLYSGSKWIGYVNAGVTK